MHTHEALGARRRRLFLLAALAVLMVQLVAAFTAVSHASTKWYQSCQDPEAWAPPTACVQWTGGWPGGQVRAFSGSGTIYEVELQVCLKDQGIGCVDKDFHTIATQTKYVPYGRTTAAKAVAKNGHYRACFEETKGSSPNCWVASDSVYLGD